MTTDHDADTQIAVEVDLDELRDRWSARWPDALALWSPFTRLRPPVWCLTESDEQREGLTGSFAMIRLTDQTVVISVRQVQPALGAFPLEILGHEIGHHILCPADLADNARMLARIRRALPTVEHHAPMVGNLYADVLINDRLQRARGLDMAGVYAALGPSSDHFWTFYLRLYEILWALPTATLAAGTIDETLEGDAQLGARVIRTFAGRWLDGAGRFAALCLPYLIADGALDDEGDWVIWQDAVGAGAGGFPDGLTSLDPGERDVVHPALDPELNGDLARRTEATTAEGPQAEPAEPDPGARIGGGGQFREPFEYGEILAASGVLLDEHEITARYYRERAIGHLIPFPTRPAPVVTDPLPEGVEPWDIGAPLMEVDWTETALRGGVVIPGVTTVRREWGTNAGADPERVPVDLDLYIDSSMSMPDPSSLVSYLALAGTIVALSALRAGARVQATLWSGPDEFTTTRGFVRDERAVLRVITGFIGGSTAFPIHVTRDTYERRAPDAPPAHVLVVSDDGVTTMFADDERGRPGRDVMNHALARAAGGATMVLNLWRPIEEDPELVTARADGWDIHVVHDWTDLVSFARAFSRRTYEQDRRGAIGLGGPRGAG